MKFKVETKVFLPAAENYRAGSHTVLFGTERVDHEIATWLNSLEGEVYEIKESQVTSLNLTCYIHVRVYLKVPDNTEESN